MPIKIVATCNAVTNRRIRSSNGERNGGPNFLGLIRPQGWTGQLGSEPVS